MRSFNFLEFRDSKAVSVSPCTYNQIANWRDDSAVQRLFVTQAGIQPDNGPIYEDAKRLSTFLWHRLKNNQNINFVFVFVCLILVFFEYLRWHFGCGRKIKLVLLILDLLERRGMPLEKKERRPSWIPSRLKLILKRRGEVWVVGDLSWRL